MGKFLTVVGLILVVIAAIVLFRGDGVESVMPEAYYPEPTNYAVDTAGALSEEQLADLNLRLKAMDMDAHQFAVAVVKTTAPLTIEEYAIKIAEKWKVGYEGLDNGAIIVLAVDDRKVRIEVGRGLEGDITDSEAGRIIDEAMIPYLKANAWYDAIVEGLNALANEVTS